MSLSRREFPQVPAARPPPAWRSAPGSTSRPSKRPPRRLKIKEAKAVAERLSVLRGRLRPAHLRQGRQDHRHRGQPGHAAHAGAAVPEGRGDHPALEQPAAAHQGALSRAGLRQVGGEAARLDVRRRSPSATTTRARSTSSRRRRTRTARRSSSTGWRPSPRSARRASTTRSATSCRKLNRTLGIVYHEHQARV